MNRTKLVSLSVLMLTYCAWFPEANGDDVKRFIATDIFELEYANDPQISPNGNQIIYERLSNDIMTDESRSNLWIVNANGSEHRPIVSRAAQATSPRWSADSEWIAHCKSLRPCRAQKLYPSMILPINQCYTAY